jgi:hypothetical protein
MKRLVIQEISKVSAEAVLLATAIGIAIGIIGYLNHWSSAIKYSNAFFLAGCLIIIAGTSSRLAAGQEWGSFQIFSESFRDMSRSERANYIVNASSSVRLAIVGALSGLLLIVVSAIAAFMS